MWVGMYCLSGYFLEGWFKGTPEGTPFLNALISLKRDTLVSPEGHQETTWFLHLGFPLFGGRMSGGGPGDGGRVGLEAREGGQSDGALADGSFRWKFRPESYMALGQSPVPLINIKICGKWMFIHPKMES